ncbi:MAG: hypothetical protein A3J83_07270 [Elusimicrobia bacterium RIFOXYA2_FULL_40_6]|nr:MAG: hypothetical protein A3J83_07270 [Elusimicrobia bacterium RIFOXYA2_FULL_40_6]
MAEQNQLPKETKQIQIEVDDQTAQGTYCNLALVSHNETEFIFDFIFVQPQAPKAKIRSRIITSPQHMKRLLLAINDNIKKYELQFGEIKTPQPVEEKKVGFFN